MPSLSRANSAAAAPTAARVVPNKWQFVSLNEPRRNQDKKVISIVRAHAMRDVHRKRRLEFTAHHHERLKGETREDDHADCSVKTEQSLPTQSDDWSSGDVTDVDLPMALSEMLSELETGAGHDEVALHLHGWRRYGEGETRADGHLLCGISGMGTLNPKSLAGDGVSDPFNAMPIVGSANYNSHVLNHCKHLIHNPALSHDVQLTEIL